MKLIIKLYLLLIILIPFGIFAQNQIPYQLKFYYNIQPDTIIVNGKPLINIDKDYVKTIYEIQAKIIAKKIGFKDIIIESLILNKNTYNAVRIKFKPDYSILSKLNYAELNKIPITFYFGKPSIISPKYKNLYMFT